MLALVPMDKIDEIINKDRLREPTGAEGWFAGLILMIVMFLFGCVFFQSTSTPTSNIHQDTMFPEQANTDFNVFTPGL